MLVDQCAETNRECLVPEEWGYPKIDMRQGKTSWRYATSISLGEMGFLEFSHHVSTEMYVDTRKWLKSSGETGTLPRFRLRSSSFSSRPTIPAKTESIRLPTTASPLEPIKKPFTRPYSRACS